MFKPRSFEADDEEDLLAFGGVVCVARPAYHAARNTSSISSTVGSRSAGPLRMKASS